MGAGTRRSELCGEAREEQRRRPASPFGPLPRAAGVRRSDREPPRTSALSPGPSAEAAARVLSAGAATPAAPRDPQPARHGAAACVTGCPPAETPGAPTSRPSAVSPGPALLPRSGRSGLPEGPRADSWRRPQGPRGPLSFRALSRLPSRGALGCLRAVVGWTRLRGLRRVGGQCRARIPRRIPQITPAPAASGAGPRREAGSPAWACPGRDSEGAWPGREPASRRGKARLNCWGEGESPNFCIETKSVGEKTTHFQTIRIFRKKRKNTKPTDTPAVIGWKRAQKATSDARVSTVAEFGFRWARPGDGLLGEFSDPK